MPLISTKIKLQNPENQILYQSDNDYDTLEYLWDDIDYFDRNYKYFLLIRYIPLEKVKEFEAIHHDFNTPLEKIIKNIINGRNLGYELRLQDGHLEIDCINSGSRATHYIYALNDKGHKLYEAWDYGDIEDNQLAEKLLEKGLEKISFK